jgi:hypothetical protein
MCWMKSTSDRGTAQQPISLVLAVAGVIMGVAFPVVSIGGRIAGVLPIALIGAAGGLLVIGGVFFLCPADVGMPVLVILMFAVMFTSRQIGGIWLILIPSFVASAFGSAVLGGHLRFLRWRAVRRR